MSSNVATLPLKFTYLFAPGRNPRTTVPSKYTRSCFFLVFSYIFISSGILRSVIDYGLPLPFSQLREHSKLSYRIVSIQRMRAFYIVLARHRTGSLGQRVNGSLGSSFTSGSPGHHFDPV